MFKKPILGAITISLILKISCKCVFALSPKLLIHSGLGSLAYQHIGLLAGAVNDDKLLILGQTYKTNDLVLKNMKHIEPATVDDVPRIVDLYGRIRKRNSWGFNPGNREAEEQAFKTGFQRFYNGYENRLIKEIAFSPFAAIQVLHSI
jgi:hypothetical protein